ncbi:MAG: tetratricopeptide repeat protein [Planctomycetes bacterium]|nr:tetratricopeptide repeat protein [Planctomycetota bacterium]
MLSSQEDPVRARIIEAELALEVASGFLEMSVGDLVPGARSQAEAFVANAPQLWGHERDTERLFLCLDIAVSAIQADPTFGGGYALAAACIYRMGVRDVDIYDPRTLIASIPWANRAIVVDPENNAGWETYIEIHCFKGDFKTAEGALGKVYAKFGDNDVYARCAFLFFRLQGDVVQAKNWGALAWQTEWDSTRLVHTLFSLGQLHRDTGEWAKALDCYRVITEKDHQNAWAFHYWAMCLANVGDPTGALEINQRAVQLGQLHEFRSYQEDLRRMAGRAKLGAGRITNLPPARMPTGNTSRITAPAKGTAASGNTSRMGLARSGNTTTGSGRVVPTPPAAGSSNRMLPPQPGGSSSGSGRVMPAPPPANAPRVAPAPPPAAPRVMPAPPAAAPQKVAPAPPPAKPSQDSGRTPLPGAGESHRSGQQQQFPKRETRKLMKPKKPPQP